MVSQISTIQEVHDKIKIFSVLEGIVHVDQEWTVKLCENWSFIHYTFYASFCQYPGLAHFFHCIFHLEFFTIDLPNFTETTFSNTKAILKTGFAYGYIERKRLELLIKLSLKGMKSSDRLIISNCSIWWLLRQLYLY